MKYLIIICLFIGLSLKAQEPIVYVCQFSTQETATEVISQTDSLWIAIANPNPSIIGYSQNWLNSDSTAIYEAGVFYNFISYVELPVLNEYVIYPCVMKQRWQGMKEENYKIKE